MFGQVDNYSFEPYEMLPIRMPTKLKGERMEEG